MKPKRLFITQLMLCFCIFGQVLFAQTTEFTYQGSLKDAGNPASGNYDFEFALFDSLSGGSQVGPTIPKNMVAVANGIFTVKLDFGSAFPGGSRYLEIRVRLTGQPGLTPLSPRQAVNSSPYSITAADATSSNLARLTVPNTAMTATGTATVTSGFITSANVTNGGAGYTTPPTVTVNDPTGSGAVLTASITAGVVTSVTVQNPGSGYSAGASLTLSSPPSNSFQTFVTPNFFTGVNTMNNANNTFAGSFTGSGSGLTNVNADNATNALNLGGVAAGQYVVTTDPRMTDSRNPLPNSSNYIQNQNAGAQATSNFNISGNGTAGGTLTGNIVNATTQYNIGGSRVLGVGGTNNTFTGIGAGQSITTGSSNSYFGNGAGSANLTNSNNSFFGYQAGSNNTADGNTFFGSGAGFANTFSDFNSFFGFQAGNANTGSQNTFIGHSAGVSTTGGSSNTFVGSQAGFSHTNGISNTFLGRTSGFATTTGSANTFVGNAGTSNTTGSQNTAIGNGASVGTNLTGATAIGSFATATASNRIQLGQSGTATVSIGLLTTASATQLCINGTVLSSCSSSRRYKENIRPFESGLNLVRRLQPVTFDWKERKETDLGLIAEEVALIDPLLVTRNENGNIEGVKYDQISVLTINAIKEQQVQIEAQQKEIAELKKIICAIKSDAEFCRDTFPAK